MGMPFTVEDLYLKNFEYADLVAYPLSPTIAYPSTYPMLDPNPEDCDAPDICKLLLCICSFVSTHMRFFVRN